MYIEFKNISYKNFMGAGNIPVDIDLNIDSSTIFFGQNGSGKSTFIDAIYFALFGKSYRKDVKKTLINRTNKKGTLVELEINIDENNFKIIRGIKPDTFEIYKNGEEVDKSNNDYQTYLESYVLHMDEKMFRQIVILGTTNYVPFMELTGPDRRVVIEGILDIAVFSTMNKIAKTKHKMFSNEVNNLGHKIETLSIKIDAEKLIEKERSENIDEKKKLITEQIDAINERKRANASTVKELNETLARLESELPDKKTVDDSVSYISKMNSFVGKFEHENRDSSEKIQFFYDNNVCPVCSSELDKGFRDDKIIFYKDSMANNEENLTLAKKKINEFQKIVDKFRTVSLEIKDITSKINSEMNLINVLDSQIEQLAREKDSIIIKESCVDIHALISQLDEMRTNLSDAERQLKLYNHILVILKDSGVKRKVIHSQLPVINSLIKKYLQVLDFPVEFEFDDGFAEKIIVRGRDAATYKSMSAGEKMRINLAILFAFRELSVLRNSPRTNLIIFDELADSSLDSEGWDMFMKVINSESDMMKNVFVISHKGDEIMGKFTTALRFSKLDGVFSSYEVVDN